MPTNYVKRSSVASPLPDENWLIWFSGKGIEGCKNALLLCGSGEIHLLKTEKVIGRAELDKLDLVNWTAEDYEKWKEIFGDETASNELRTAYRRFRQVNELP